MKERRGSRASPARANSPTRKSAIQKSSKLGLPVERDRHFVANKTISDHADQARAQGRIVA
jgi:hypothetical protein